MTDPLHGWRNQIHQGNALAILSQLPSASIGLIVTSPPYNVRNSTGHGINSASSAWPTNKFTNGYPDHTDDMPRPDYLAWQRACISEMLRVLTDDGALFYNHRPRVQGGLQESPRDIIAGFHLRDEIIWHKGGGINHTPAAFTPAYEVIYHIVKTPHQFRRAAGSVDYSNVWQIARERDNDHPAPFPVEIPRRCIQASDSPIVLDPFMGSGTTGVAAVIEGRQYVGIELNAQYCQSARLRIRRASPTVHHPPPASPPLPVAAPPTETRPALPPSELKPRERLLFDHIATLIAVNHHQPITTTAKHLAAHLATNPAASSVPSKPSKRVAFYPSKAWARPASTRYPSRQIPRPFQVSTPPAPPLHPLQVSELRPKVSELPAPPLRRLSELRPKVSELRPKVSELSLFLSEPSPPGRPAPKNRHPSRQPNLSELPPPCSLSELRPKVSELHRSVRRLSVRQLSELRPTVSELRPKVSELPAPPLRRLSELRPKVSELRPKVSELSLFLSEPSPPGRPG